MVLKHSLTVDLQDFLLGKDNAVSKIVDLNMYLLKKVEVLDTQISKVVSQLDLHERGHQARYSALEYDMKKLESENNRLKHMIAQTEDSARILYLRIEGLPELNNENVRSHVANTLSRTGIQCDFSDIDFARRIGKYKKGQKRPILVRFFSEDKRNAFLYNRANLNQSVAPNMYPVWINDDVSDLTRRCRKSVRDVATLAKQQGIPNIKVHGDGIVVNDSKFKHIDLDLLPPHLAISEAKTREDGGDVYFQSELSILSNFFPAKQTDARNKVYSCAEQAFQYRKAIECNYPLIAQKLLVTHDPYEIKRLGNQIEMNAKWRAREEDIMSEILLSKFSQNEVLGDFLMKTHGKQLHEASNDSKWATGAELSSRAAVNGTWNGADLLGRLLEGVRETLFNLTGRTPPSAPSYTNYEYCEDEDPRPLLESGNVSENCSYREELEMDDAQEGICMHEDEAISGSQTYNKDRVPPSQINSTSQGHQTALNGSHYEVTDPALLAINPPPTITFMNPYSNLGPMTTDFAVGTNPSAPSEHVGLDTKQNLKQKSTQRPASAKTGGKSSTPKSQFQSQSQTSHNTRSVTKVGKD